MRQGVIFDMDGVLVASGPAHLESWRILARKHGVQISDESFVESFGKTSRDIIRAVWGADLSAEEVRAYDNEKEAVYRELISGLVPLTIGTREVLANLSRAGFVLAVATSAPPENLELVLREAHLARYFAATVDGADIQHGKPAPDCFLLAAERAALRPADCIVVEDAPVGIQAALAAGMKVVGFVGTHSAERLRQAGPTRILERLADITPEFVSDLLRG